MVSVTKGAWSIFRIFSDIDSISGIVKKIFGKDGVKEHLPDEFKAFLGGVLSNKDNLAFYNLMNQETGGLNENAQKAVQAFIDYEFRRHLNAFEIRPGVTKSSLVRKIFYWWYINNWRTFVLKLESPGGEVSHSEKTMTTEEEGNKKTVTTITRDVKSEGGGQSLAFLVKISKMIRINNQVSDEGLKAASEYQRKFDFPMMPSEETLVWLEQAFGKVPELANAFARISLSFIEQIPQLVRDNAPKVVAGLKTGHDAVINHSERITAKYAWWDLRRYS